MSLITTAITKISSAIARFASRYARKSLQRSFQAGVILVASQVFLRVLQLFTAKKKASEKKPLEIESKKTPQDPS